MMDWFLVVIGAGMAISLIGMIYSDVMLRRNNILYQVQRKAIDLCTLYGDWSEFERRSYEQMLYDFRKWTFKDFYPELAKREAQANGS